MHLTGELFGIISGNIGVHLGGLEVDKSNVVAASEVVVDGPSYGIS